VQGTADQSLSSDFAPDEITIAELFQFEKSH